MKKAVSFILAIILVFSSALVCSAASISSNKHTATGIIGGQTVYIKSNTGWNTEAFCDTYRTKIQVKLPSSCFEEFQFNLSTSKDAKVNVTVYKKVNSSWVKQSALSGSYNCNSRGYICNAGGSTKTWVLPGKGVEYKVVIAPKMTWLTRDWLGFDSVSDMKGFTLNITSYGTITKVA